jgi:hypothetical protein
MKITISLVFDFMEVTVSGSQGVTHDRAGRLRTVRRRLAGTWRTPIARVLDCRDPDIGPVAANLQVRARTQSTTTGGLGLRAESGLTLDPGSWIGDKGYVGNEMITPSRSPPIVAF